MSKTILKKGDKVFVSEKGHRGFLYPSKKMKIILRDVNAESLCWIGGGDLKPFLIQETGIRALANIKSMTAVWI